MRLIIGLGNPGEKYEKTRHNIGFLVVGKIAEKRGITFRLESMYDSRYAEMGDFEHRIKLVEPQTFMNESGKAVGKTKNFFKVDSEDIWVIHDDVDLEPGKVRINLGGSSAGHKGVQSIIDAIGPEFWRIRIGVGKSDKIPTESWVLMSFEDTEKLENMVDMIADFVLESLSKGIKEETINI
ncbi:TPA: aminoacyl-tRNA hydrolase [Candidatus Berkelbacteria bacterium]|uniref:Peptidyl-tRNA hydrolase n=1 Tax=Berkelbacteria bacterium GW2011_GWE1_39_12 TaxID=1618337 RepID=A0A0G4B202_9BACT|nr:MAG: peptidyl-tRNA hydrolase [Berkelbacteria bacterium GW2011_GWE1_39_12]HBO60436.1 aminoacyl-tRNA hydrolase [Candidatus Berkelbacteria bacterium]